MKVSLSALLPVALLVGASASVPTPSRSAQVVAPPVRVRSSKPRPKISPTPAMPPDSPVRQAVEASMAKDFEKADALLMALDPAAMIPSEARRWRIYAQFTAPRTGNRTLMKRANAGGWGLLFADARQILNAWEVAQAGDLPRAKAILRKVSDPENLDERSRRRYLALLAGMAQAEGDTKSERQHLTQLVDYVGSWKSDTCQSCHENPEKYGDDVTSLDVNGLWIGKRYSALLKQDGDAAKVQQAARQRLAADSEDEAARLHLAYALRAENREADAVQELRKLDWAVFPDRPYKEPIDKITFPGDLPVAHPRPVASFLPEDQVVSAADYLRAGEFRRCRKELQDLGPMEKLSPRLRYRSAAVRASLARLENDPPSEKRALQDLVAIVTGTDDRPGLSPLAPGEERNGEKATFSTWQTWWVTKRLEALGDEQTATKIKQAPPVQLMDLDLTKNDVVQFP